MDAEKEPVTIPLTINDVKVDGNDVSKLNIAHAKYLEKRKVFLESSQHTRDLLDELNRESDNIQNLMESIIRDDWLNKVMDATGGENDPVKFTCDKLPKFINSQTGELIVTITPESKLHYRGDKIGQKG
jgi:uncharacterized protein YcgI (DUF1989 family)